MAIRISLFALIAVTLHTHRAYIPPPLLRSIPIRSDPIRRYIDPTRASRFYIRSAFLSIYYITLNTYKTVQYDMICSLFEMSVCLSHIIDSQFMQSTPKAQFEYSTLYSNRFFFACLLLLYTVYMYSIIPTRIMF